MQIIHTNAAPAAVGPYSQAVVTGSLIYTAGQVPLDPETGLDGRCDVLIDGDRITEVAKRIETDEAFLKGESIRELFAGAISSSHLRRVPSAVTE